MSTTQFLATITATMVAKKGKNATNCGTYSCRFLAIVAKNGDYNSQLPSWVTIVENLSVWKLQKTIRFEISNHKPTIQFESKWKTTIRTALVLSTLHRGKCVDGEGS